LYRVEKCIEQNNYGGWKTLFYFELIPKHQQQKEIFACDTQENRTVIKKNEICF
jgi:hypothetical protein